MCDVQPDRVRTHLTDRWYREAAWSGVRLASSSFFFVFTNCKDNTHRDCYWSCYYCEHHPIISMHQFGKKSQISWNMLNEVSVCIFLLASPSINAKCVTTLNEPIIKWQKFFKIKITNWFWNLLQVGSFIWFHFLWELSLCNTVTIISFRRRRVSVKNTN